MRSLLYTTEEEFPENISEVLKLKPLDVVFDAYARVQCQACGLWNRAILCPPHLYLTYPQFKTLNSSIEFFGSFDYLYLYIFKNDGSKKFWYPRDEEKFSSIRLRKVSSGRQLKGIEAVGSRYLNQLLFKIRNLNSSRGWDVFAFTNGHCDLCARKCPNRNNPPCRNMGLPSLEACCVNVYETMRKLKIPYEYPVTSELLTVQGLLARKRRPK